MANIEESSIMISLLLIAVHAITLVGTEQIMATDYSNVGFSFLPDGADNSSDLNASSFEVFDSSTLDNAEITPLDILINPLKLAINLASVALGIALSTLEFFINIPVYSFVFLDLIGLPDYMIWVILVPVFAIEMWGILLLFLRFISAVSGVAK